MRATFERNFVALSSFVVVAAVSIYVMRHTHTTPSANVCYVVCAVPVPCTRSQFPFYLLPVSLLHMRRVTYALSR